MKLEGRGAGSCRLLGLMMTLIYGIDNQYKIVITDH